MKTVYMAVDEGEILKKILLSENINLLIGDGKNYDSKALEICDAMIVGTSKVTAETVSQLKKARVIVKPGAGTENIDVDACTRAGIMVCNTPEESEISIAEHTMTMILSCAKKIYQLSTYVRREYPDFTCKERYRGIELYDKTITVIGLGNVGRRVCTLADAFGMQVIGFDPNIDRRSLPEYVDYELSLEAALASADFVTIHVPDVESNWHLIGRRELASMKNSAILINTAGGFVIDQAELINALKQKEIAGVGLDAFEKEPITPGCPLLFMENVLLTPHTSENTLEARKRVQKKSAERVISVLKGEIPIGVLNAEALSRQRE